jgi:HAE1 family hydrophobic/amphiphilic exporter-1
LGGFAFVSEAAEAADRELDIIFTGKDDAVLRSIARDAAHQIGTLSGIAECVLRFREGKPSYRLIVDREKSGAFGIASDRLAHFFHGALFGPVALKHHTGEREVDVRVKFDRTKGGGISNLLSGSLPLGSERSVPLSQLVRIEEGSEATRLTRYNGRRAVRITARFGSISPDTAAQRIREKLAALSLPEDYGWEFDTAYEKSRKNVRLMALLVFVAFLIVYMVMAAILESLRLPLLIIATVPIGICGVIIAFFLSGSTLNSSAFMGLIVLAGIAVNNGIVIVEQVSFHVRTSKRRLTPENISALAQHVSLAHFRPLLSTTLTTIGGFIPALVSFGEGSSLWRPLALAVVSGLAVSSLASGILIPIIIHKFFYTPWRNT